MNSWSFSTKCSNGFPIAFCLTPNRLAIWYLFPWWDTPIWNFGALFLVFDFSSQEPPPFFFSFLTNWFTMCFDIRCSWVQSIFFSTSYSLPVQMCILHFLFLFFRSGFSFLIYPLFFRSLSFIITIIITNFSFLLLPLLGHGWLGSSCLFNFIFKREGRAIYLCLFILSSHHRHYQRHHHHDG